MIENNPLNSDAGLPEGNSSIEGGSAGALGGMTSADLRRGYKRGQFLAENEAGEGADDLDETYVMPELLDRTAGAGWLDD